MNETISMVEHIGLAAIYEGIAEEAAELAAAAAKMGRILRGQNPTGINYDECKGRVVTELTHLSMYTSDIGLFPNNVIADQAKQRFIDRISSAKK